MSAPRSKRDDVPRGTVANTATVTPPRKVGPPAGNRGKGRPKGSLNKVTVAAKEAFTLAFKGSGGVDEFVAWAKENRTEFYKLYSKLLPLDVTSGNEPFKATQTIVIGDRRIEF